MSQRQAQLDPLDDWETAYYRADELLNGQAQRNTKLWADANTKQSYTITSSTGSPFTTSHLPPPTAFAPALTILKRPTSSTGSSRSVVKDGEPQKTLEERNKDYAIARARIYGTAEPSSESSRVDRLTANMSTTSIASGSSTSSTSAHHQPQQQQRQLGNGQSSATRAPARATALPASDLVRHPKGPAKDGIGFAAVGTPHGEGEGRASEGGEGVAKEGKSRNRRKR